MKTALIYDKTIKKVSIYIIFDPKPKNIFIFTFYVSKTNVIFQLNSYDIY